MNKPTIIFRVKYIGYNVVNNIINKSPLKNVLKYISHTSSKNNTIEITYELIKDYNTKEEILEYIESFIKNENITIVYNNLEKFITDKKILYIITLEKSKSKELINMLYENEICKNNIVFRRDLMRNKIQYSEYMIHIDRNDSLIFLSYIKKLNNKDIVITQQKINKK